MLTTRSLCLQVYQAQGKLDEAAESIKKGLHIMKKTLGEEHPSVAITHRNMCRLFIKRGDHDTAVQWGALSLKVNEQKMGPQHQQTGQTLLWLGLANAHKGEHAEAKEMLERAERIFKGALGASHPLVAQAYHNQGEAALVNKDMSTATERLQAALNLREHCLGQDHYETQETRLLLEKCQLE
jgi:tetratricopeptide (TPR) repeat protein